MPPRWRTILYAPFDIQLKMTDESSPFWIRTKKAALKKKPFNTFLAS